MKTIYLRDENYNWKAFKYEDLETLKDEVLSREISIGNGASIGDEIKLITGIYFNGLKHSVTYVGENKISIGCNCFTIDYWIENFKAIGEKNNYSEEQIKEYGSYIKTIDY